VELEASLLLACSPLLRRTLVSTCCGSCSSAPATLVLPSTTSTALNQLVQVVAKGSVNIATDDLDELGSLFALMEIDFGRAGGAKGEVTDDDLETPPAVLRNSSSAPSSSSPTAGTSTASKLEAFNFSSPTPSLLVSSPLPQAHAHKIKSSTQKLPKNSVACFFCELEMPSGTDQNLYLQHLETCIAREVLEADHLQKALKTEEEVIAPGNPSQCVLNHEDDANLNKKPMLKCLDQSCTSKFSLKHNLHQHMWTRHGVGRGLTCDVCGKRLQSPYQMNDHMRAKHEAPKLQCEVVECDSSFNYFQAMMKHMKTEHGAP